MFSGRRTIFSTSLHSSTYVTFLIDTYKNVVNDPPMKKYQKAYEEFYDMGMEARRLKNMRSVEGVTLLLDSTLSEWHNPATNLNLKAHKTVSITFKFFLLMIKIQSV